MPYRIGEEKAWKHRRQNSQTSAAPEESTDVPTTTSSPTTTSTPDDPTTTSTPPTTTSTSTSEPPDPTTPTSRPNGGDITTSTSSRQIVTSVTITSTRPDGSTEVIGSVSTPQSVQTTITQTYVVTSNGLVYTTTTVTPTMVGNSSGGSKGGTNIGAIVGGVIGGIAALGLLLLLAFWLRRRSKKEDFDETFDPDRAQRPGRMRGSIDLNENPDMAPHPYNFQSATRPLSGGAVPVRSSTDGSQGFYPHAPAPGQIYQPGTVNYGTSPYPAMGPQSAIYSPGPSNGSVSYPMSDGGQSGSSGRTPYSGRASTAGVAGLGAGGMLLGVPTTTSHSHSSSGPSAKEREAMIRSGAMHLASGEDEDYGRPVVQHSDGGRIPEQEQPKEVPPAYDTIPQDERSGPSGSRPGPSRGSLQGDISLSDGDKARAEAAGPEKGPRPNFA
ncbi:hypothetical protein FRC02_007974 [Tulasnella sp. 418]|nr:hypothetical protein FRC02_007974 [Tulasnella sp. 418]